jgi:hypothetical protein
MHAYAAGALLPEKIQNGCQFCWTRLTCCFSLSQCFLFCSHFYYFKQESATNTKTHTWKFTIDLQSSLSTTDLEFHMCKLTMGSQAQPFNSTVNSRKNTLSGCVALLHGSGREGSDLSNHKMEEMTSDTFFCLQTC